MTFSPKEEIARIVFAMKSNIVTNALRRSRNYQKTNQRQMNSRSSTVFEHIEKSFG